MFHKSIILICETRYYTDAIMAMLKATNGAGCNMLRGKVEGRVNGAAVFIEALFLG